MSKLPKPILILIFLFLCSLLGCIIAIVRMQYGFTINMTEDEFYILFGFFGILGILTGIAFILPFKTWTTEDFVEQQNNLISINKLIIGLYEQKCKLKIQTPALDKIPDSVQVVISEHKIILENRKKTEKIK